MKHAINTLSEMELSEVINAINGFNKGGEDYRITKLDLNENEGVVNFNAENSSSDVKGMTLITRAKKIKYFDLKMESV